MESPGPVFSCHKDKAMQAMAFMALWFALYWSRNEKLFQDKLMNILLLMIINQRLVKMKPNLLSRAIKLLGFLPLH